MAPASRSSPRRRTFVSLPPTKSARATPPPPLADEIRAHARRLGFTLVGIVRPDPTTHLDFYRGWIAAGRHGEMGYLARPDAVARRGDLRGTLATVRSVVVVGLPYFADEGEARPVPPSSAVIARYARGRD